MNVIMDKMVVAAILTAIVAGYWGLFCLTCRLYEEAAWRVPRRWRQGVDKCRRIWYDDIIKTAGITGYRRAVVETQV